MAIRASVGARRALSWLAQHECAACTRWDARIAIFALAPGGAGEEEIRGVGTRDQEQESHRAEHHH